MNAASAGRPPAPADTALRAGDEPAWLCLPDRRCVFADRTARLRRLADGHAMRDYLLFAAEIAHAQHAALQAAPPVALPTARQLEAAAAAGLPPLTAAAGWPRDGAWRALLRDLLARIAGRVPAAAAPAARRLAAGPDDDLERQADRLLAGRVGAADVGNAPLIGAGLQVYFTHLVASTQAAHEAPFGRTDDATRCPCCGSPPSAGIVHVGRDPVGRRYLHCALCNSQWHRVRIACCRCLSAEDIGYASALAVAPPQGVVATTTPRDAMQAECCGACGHYLKIVRGDIDPRADPVADDLATLALDLLLADAGRRRHGVNPMLAFADAAA